jgi:hypothetical protein
MWRPQRWSLDGWTSVIGEFRRTSARARAMVPDDGLRWCRMDLAADPLEGPDEHDPTDRTSSDAGASPVGLPVGSV